MSEVQCPKCGEHHIRTDRSFFDAVQGIGSIEDQPGWVPAAMLAGAGLTGLGLSLFLYVQPQPTPSTTAFSLFLLALSVLFLCGAIAVGFFRNRRRRPEFTGGGYLYEYTCLTCGYRWPGHLTTYSLKDPN